MVILENDKLKEILQSNTLIYCKHKIGQSGTCANLATKQVKLCSRNNKTETDLSHTISYRCNDHENSGTVGKKVFEVQDFNQDVEIEKVNRFLDSIIGKTIKSKAHTAIGLEVKYRKENCGVMCFQPITKKWKFVYYNQISRVY